MKQALDIVILENATLTFSSEAGEPIHALHNLCLSVHPGEWLYVVGRNGCGKTTLLRALAGQIPLDSGVVRFAEGNQNGVFFVEGGSNSDLVPSMTVYENLALLNLEHGKRPDLSFYRQKSWQNECQKVLALFGLGLESRLHDQVVQMSSGQKQAVVAAKVLLSRARLILLDEFTSALDKQAAPAILRILRQHVRDSGVTVISVTHDYHWIQETADRVALMDEGAISQILRSARLNEKTSAGFPHTPLEIVVPHLTGELVMERLYGQG